MRWIRVFAGIDGCQHDQRVTVAAHDGRPIIHHHALVVDLGNICARRRFKGKHREIGPANVGRDHQAN